MNQLFRFISLVYLAALSIGPSTGAADSPDQHYVELPNLEVPVDDLPSDAPPSTDGSNTPYRKPGVPGSTGLCVAGPGKDSTGHEQRCCRQDTTGVYFLDRETGRSRRCDGQWENTGVSCVLSSNHPEAATLWRCNVPSTEPPPADTSGDEAVSVSANRLAQLPDGDYDRLQKKYLDTTYPACNYFLITALCEAGFCRDSKPLYQAGEFDTYFIAHGWIEISLEQVKKRLRSSSSVNIVGQREAPSPKGNGHVLVPVALDETGRLIIAEGALGESTHHFRTLPDSYFETFKGGMRFFALPADGSLLTHRMR